MSSKLKSRRSVPMHSATVFAMLVLVSLFTSSSVCSTWNVTLQWYWDDPARDFVFSTPVVVNLTDDNGDGVVDACDNPEVAFLADSLTTGTTRLFVVDGDSGKVLTGFPAGDSLTHSALAAADIVGDPVAELIAIKVVHTTLPGSLQIVAFNSSGTQVVTGEVTGAIEGGGQDQQHNSISVADLDGDGAPEILVGEAVFDTTGSLLWDGAGSGGPGRGIISHYTRTSTAVNLNMSGDLEVLAGNRAYESDGTVLWQFGNVDGASAVGNYVADPYPEVVFVYEDTIRLLDHSGNAVGSPFRFGIGVSHHGVFPALGQFDTDSLPEVAETDGESLYALNFTSNGGGGSWQKMWAIGVEDSAGRAGVSVADLDGDGIDEILYRDIDTLRIVDGETGVVEWKTKIVSGTAVEYPVAADIDGDNRLEVVVPGGETGTFWALGVSAFDCEDWVDGRRVWNDYTYHVTNINEDGTVPVDEDECWLMDNSFLAQENRCVLCDKEVYTNWTIEAVRTETSGPFNSIALRDNTFPHIGFRDDSIGGLWYVFKDTIPRRIDPDCDSFPLWRTVRVDSGLAVHWTSTDILPRSLHAEFSYADSANWDVRWAAATAADQAGDCDLNVDTLNLDTEGYLGIYGTDMALDTTGTAPYCGVVYYDASNTNLKYAERQDDHWTVTTIDSVGDVGRYPAIAIDRTRARHVSYYDGTKGDLRYAYCQSGCSLAVNWRFYIPDSTVGARVGLFTEIATNPFNYARISYIDSTHHALKCVLFKFGGWDTVTVEGSPNDLIASTSIGAAGRDTAHISYSDRTERTLKCASCYHDCDDAANWDKLTIPDSWSDVGFWNSIAVGRGDTVHISYSGSDSVCDFKALKYVVGKP